MVTATPFIPPLNIYTYPEMSKSLTRRPRCPCCTRSWTRPSPRTVSAGIDVADVAVVAVAHGALVANVAVADGARVDNVAVADVALVDNVAVVDVARVDNVAVTLVTNVAARVVQVQTAVDNCGDTGDNIAVVIAAVTAAALMPVTLVVNIAHMLPATCGAQVAQILTTLYMVTGT